MQEADHLIGRAVGDRIAGPLIALHQPDCLVGGHIAGKEIDLGTRHHHFAQAAVPRVEDVVDDASLLVAEHVRVGHHRTQVVLGDGLSARLGVTAEYAHHDVRALVDQPDQGGRGLRDRADHRREREGVFLGALHGQPLGGELAQHDRQE
ncbi:hypothetical protein SDC9_117842 [bioreactor metagenome]|uniref:Uncharacterized protein n=1 Tax=bioreactor metagenome TaxID=1076179 RepID=A0A645C1S1_9ZZZZ